MDYPESLRKTKSRMLVWEVLSEAKTPLTARAIAQTASKKSEKNAAKDASQNKNKAEEGKNGGAGHRFADWVRGLFRTKEILEYEDDVERTADLKSVLAEGGKRARKWLGRLREKPERFEDMPDDRYRLRFAYKALLKSGRVAGWIPSATPKEVGGKMETQALKDMTEAYCAARYDLEKDVTPEQAETARAAMQVLSRRGR